MDKSRSIGVENLRVANVGGAADEESELFATALAKSVFGDVAGSVVSAEVLGVLGLGQAPDYTSYFNQINAKLDQLSIQAVQIQQSIDKVQAGIATIEEQITESSIQPMLLNFSQCATVISTNFGSYRAAVTALLSSDKTVQTQGIQQLYNLFSVTNAQIISENLQNIQNAFVPTLSEEKGLLEYQFDHILDATIAYSSNSDNYKLPALPGNAVWQEIPSTGGLWAGELIMTGSYAAATATMKQDVANTLTAFLNIQLQGLILLNAAWIGSINEGQLQPIVTNLKAIVQQIASFYDNAVPKINNQVAANLQQFGKYMVGPAASSQTWGGDIGYLVPGWVLTDINDPYVGYPMSNDWIMWNRAYPGSPVGDMAFVYQPWAQPWVNSDSTVGGVSYTDGRWGWAMIYAAGQPSSSFNPPAPYVEPIPAELSFCTALKNNL